MIRDIVQAPAQLEFNVILVESAFQVVQDAAGECVARWNSITSPDNS